MSVSFAAWKNRVEAHATLVQPFQVCAWRFSGTAHRAKAEARLNTCFVGFTNRLTNCCVSSWGHFSWQTQNHSVRSYDIARSIALHPLSPWP